MVDGRRREVGMESGSMEKIWSFAADYEAAGIDMLLTIEREWLIAGKEAKKGIPPAREPGLYIETAKSPVASARSKVDRVTRRN